MSLNNINTIGTYNITCGGVNNSSCPPKPDNPEARAFDNAFSGWKKKVEEGGFIIDLEKGSLVVGGPDAYRDNISAKKPVSRSEDTAYGLYFAVTDGDRETFDKFLNGLENYARNENGLYSWLLTDQGAVLESHSAADADMYAAAAIILAYAKWGDPRYRKIAQRLVDAIWEKDISKFEYKGYYVIKPSDHKKLFVYGDGRFVYNPSYFAPALLKIFAAVDNNPEHNWNKVIDDGYQLLEKIIVNAGKAGYWERKDTDTNPVPDWLLGNIFDKNFYVDKYSVTPHKGYDAIRVFLELARDKKDPRAQRMANLILNKIASNLTPQTARLAGNTNELSTAYYGLLYLTSSRSRSIGESFIAQLRNAYHDSFIGSSELDKKSYYFQSLLLHATATLAGYGFKLEALSALPAQDYEKYIPHRIEANEDGSVYVDYTLIYKYEKEWRGLSPYQRAEASARTLKEAYLNGHLRPKYLEKESAPRQGTMVANYYWGLKEKTLFELGPEDFGQPGDATLGYGWGTGIYRTTIGWLSKKLDWFPEIVSYKEIDPSYQESWLAAAANFIGIKARKNSLEYAWDETYNNIYQNLTESGIVNFRKEAEQELEHPPKPKELANGLVDYYTLTNSARHREVALYSRAYDDAVSLRYFISSFLDKNPLPGFSRPNGYYETLFSLAGILTDQDGRYPIFAMGNYLRQIETQVKCRENYIPTGMCSDFTAPDFPIEGLANSKSYLEAAGKVLETILQSDISNYGYKARALREKADLNFRITEKGIQITEEHPIPAPELKEILTDYLSALEIWKDQFNLSGLIKGNWRENPSHLEIKKKLNDPKNFYGLAEEYTHASYKSYGDRFELAKISISLGKFYLLFHAREERFDELPSFDNVRYQGLKEAETWFKFVADDPRGFFDDRSLNPYKIDARIELAHAQMQLGLLELARGNSLNAWNYFDSALKNSDNAYGEVKIEINRMRSEDWINEGSSMNLRNIYFNVLLTASRIKLELAKRQKNKPQELVGEANSYMEEAVQNKDMIIFGSTKEDVYKTALWALKARPEITEDSVPKLVSIVEIDTFTENSFGVRDLQLMALALLIYHSLKTSANPEQAETKFTQILPWAAINRSLRVPLGLEDLDLEHTKDAFKSLIEALIRQPLVPDQIKETLGEAIKQ